MSLKENLDRETVDHHQLQILATNLESYPNKRVSDNSILLIDIVVNDVNDNPPKFRYENYAVGVSEKDNIEKTLLTLYADDPDLDDVVTYYLLTDTIVATGENLENVKNTAFLVNEVSGALTLNFALQKDMKGFFEFKVQARDLVLHTDEAFVKIYLVAEASRVAFSFINDVQMVRSVDLQRFSEILSTAYESECVVDEIQGAIVDGVVFDSITEVRVHFVLNNEAVDANVIYR